jgi:hypothetical protein
MDVLHVLVISVFGHSWLSIPTNCERQDTAVIVHHVAHRVDSKIWSSKIEMSWKVLKELQMVRSLCNEGVILINNVVLHCVSQQQELSL